MVAICQRMGDVSYLWQTSWVHMWPCCLQIDRGRWNNNIDYCDIIKHFSDDYLLSSLSVTAC